MRRRPDNQDLQAQCLTLLTKAVICWNTVYIDAALTHLADSGEPILDTTAARIAPNSYQHINFLGRYDFTPTKTPLNGELRPLRV